METLKITIYYRARALFEKDGEVKEFNLLKGNSYANELIGIALNPKLYHDGKLIGEITLREFGKTAIVVPKDEERIPLLLKIWEGKILEEEELLPYGKWEKWEEAEMVWKDPHTVPVKYALEEKILFVDRVEASIYGMVESRDISTIPITKVDAFGSLMYPIYYRKVEDVEEWIFNSLEEVILDIYRQSVRAFLEAKEELGDTLSRSLFSAFPSDRSFGEIGVLKLKLMELYLSDTGRIDFYRTVEKVLSKELMKIDGIPDKYLTGLGNFKGAYWDYLRELRKKVEG